MLLNLRNNELVFSKIRDVTEFRNSLSKIKRLKVREYDKKFYISLADFDAVRRVIGSEYKNRIRFTIAYERFANRFVLSKDKVIINWYPSYCDIKGPNLPWGDIITCTSYFDKKAFNSRRYGKSWSGYTHLFDSINGTFPSGLLEKIVESLRRNDIPYEVNRSFEYPRPYIKLNPTFDFTPTDDQIAAVDALAKANNGIGKLPTGFGKTSYVAASLIAKKGVRSLFLANQKVLTDDAKKDFEHVFAGDNIKIGTIGDGEFNPGDITIASIQSIAAALKEPSTREKLLAEHELDLAKKRFDVIQKRGDDVEALIKARKEVNKYQTNLDSIRKKIDRYHTIIPFLKSVDLFIVDEAQVLGTDQWNSFLNICPAPYRYTLSATDTRTDGGRIQIVAATGERRYESSAAEQIEKGRLSEFLGHFTKFDHKLDKKVIKDMKLEYHQAYDTFIVHNEKRNRHLCEKVVEWAKDNHVLALVTRKVHGEIIKEMLISMGLNENDICYVDGDTPNQIRQDSIEAFRNGEFKVLLGTSIFDVGFNAKNASKLVRFNAGGSEVKEPQRAGRTVRKREDGSIGESYDLIDINVPFFEAQGWKRMRFLKEEFGNQRVKVHKTVIEGDMNIVGLKELVAAIPDETDRKKGEEIIETLTLGEDDVSIPDYDTNDFEPDLEKILDQFRL